MLARALAHDEPPKPEVHRDAPASLATASPPAPLVVDLAPFEVQLLLADRLACFGALSSAVVHEVSQPVGFLIASLGFAIEELNAVLTGFDAESGAGEAVSPPPRAALQSAVDALQEARQTAERVRRLVRDLRTFSRTDDDRSGLLDVRRVLESAIHIAANPVSQRARLSKDYGTTPPVEGNEARLVQVFVNLLVNAAESIPEGDPERAFIRVTARTGNDGHCVVEISDSGRGIAAEDLERIFDPFFTTKPARGPGLGLFTCRYVVASMGGSIAVSSAPGEGTTFTLSLPNAHGGLSTSQTSIPPPNASPSAHPPRGRVLVVDDEPMMVRAIARLLEGEHEVFSTTDPAFAVAEVARGARFDAILCDLMMPTMSGMDVFEAIRRIAPDQAKSVIFVTGGAFTPALQMFLSSVENARIEKPIDRTTLRAAIRAQLSG
jgi:two-component system cell cycle sensor histidine kinase/response regulator CckA